jgi:protein phosphatase slingshot
MFDEFDDRPMEVFPLLFIGSLRSANNHEELQNQKILHVLTLCLEYDPKKLPGINYHKVPLKDSDTQDLHEVLQPCFEFIDQARKKDQRILVHCTQGISRSGAIVIAYIMKGKKIVEKWIVLEIL